MAREILIVLHTVAGVVCFAAGVLSLGLSTARSWPFRAYLVSLGALLVFVAAAVVVDWPDLETGARAVFVALLGLGGYMVWRAARARTRLSHREHGWQPRYVDDLGFTLIALFEGFVIVAALDLGAPGWLVGLVALGGVVGGHLALNQVKARLGGAEPVAS